MKADKKQQAILLRVNDGLSLKSISIKLGVAKSSVSRWVRDISLSDDQKKTMEKTIKSSLIRSGQLNAENWKKIRLGYQEEGASLLDKSEDRDLLIAGSMLYWGEGSKNINTVYFSNSDINMSLLFKKFLNVMGVKDVDMRLQINCYDDIHAINEIEDFWIRLLSLKKENLTKTQVNKFSSYSQKKKCGNLEWGTCRIQVCDVRIIQMIYGMIQKIGGFKENKWL